VYVGCNAHLGFVCAVRIATYYDHTIQQCGMEQRRRM